MSKQPATTVIVHRSKEFNKDYGYAKGLSTVQTRADHKREVDSVNLFQKRRAIKTRMQALRAELKAGTADQAETDRLITEYRASHPNIIHTWLANAK